MAEPAPAPASSPAVTLHRPLSRRGNGPGLIVVTEAGLDLSPQPKILDPPLTQKWAEEGFAIAHVVAPSRDDAAAAESLDAALAGAVEQLIGMETCSEKTKFGIIALLAIDNPAASTLMSERPKIAATVFFNFCPQYNSAPVLAHVPGRAVGKPTTASDLVKTYNYPSALEYFVLPGHPNYHPTSASLAHTRTLSFLKPLLGGPFFDLEVVWEEHTLYEFGERDVEKTMATMVEQPYVNHIPTLTGGIGRGPLSEFYRDHFIFNNPDDTDLELVSRTVGVDRVIDEFVFKCTHDKVIDWLLPGVPPTGKPLSIPFTSVVNVRGDRLHHEHIAWDQATALRQLGLLPEYLPFPYDVAGQPGKKLEFRVPVGGVETAKKLVDEGSEPSNRMFEYAVREA